MSLRHLTDRIPAGGTTGQALVKASNTDYDLEWGAGGGGGTPGGSDTQVQFNDSGSFGADADFTYNKTTNALTVGGLVHTPIVQAHTSAGLTLEAQGGSDVLTIGAGGGVNATAYGGWNFDGATANTIASFGASKTLESLSTATYPSFTELSYVKGVTSAIQTQINALPTASFTNFAVSGQSNVVADSASDTLTLVAGTNVTITTDAATDSITINASGGGSSAFNDLTSGTNTTAAMVVGTGASLATSGSGTIAATTATTATNGTVANEAVDTTCFPLFVTAATGDLPFKSNAGLAFNSNTGVLTSTFSGNLTGNVTGNADTATNATNATNIGTASESADTTCFPLFVTASSGGNLPAKVNASLGYNSSTNNLTATTFTGALSGNATTATTLATPRTIGGVSFDGSANIVPQTIQSVNEATDTTCFPLFITASGSQSLQPCNNVNFAFNSSTANLQTNIFTANTSILPDANDGAVIGSSSLGWSDLYLASGALIDFANGNSVITHSSGILTVSTGDLRVTTAGTNTASVVTVGGTQTLTGKTLSASVLTGTFTTSGTTTLPAFTAGGNITMNENVSVDLDAVLSADGTYSGECITGTAGATLAFGDLIYFSVTDSRWELADADASSTAGAVWLGMCVLAAAADGNSTKILLRGTIRADAAFPALTVGAPVYVSTTAGDVQTTAPSGTDDVVRIVGYGITADSMYFNPSNDWITRV